MTRDRERLVREALASTTRDTFSPGFVNRATARWRADREAALPRTIERQVRRLAPIAIAASLLLAFVSLQARDRSSEQTAAQAILGWRRTTDTTQVATLETIYGLHTPSLASR